MRPIILVAALLALASPASANSYLLEPDLATAQARSAGECTAMRCQPPTLYWWGVLTLPCGTLGATWIAIHDSGPYGSSGLTGTEIAALQSYATLSADGCFPPPSGP